MSSSVQSEVSCQSRTRPAGWTSLVVEQRTHHQIAGELMKFLTLADWTGMVETELFAQTYRRYGLPTVRYPVLEIAAKVESYENNRGFSLRVLRAGKPRQNPSY